MYGFTREHIHTLTHDQVNDYLSEIPNVQGYLNVGQKLKTTSDSVLNEEKNYTEDVITNFMRNHGHYLPETL